MAFMGMTSSGGRTKNYKKQTTLRCLCCLKSLKEMYAIASDNIERFQQKCIAFSLPNDKAGTVDVIDATTIISIEFVAVGRDIDFT